MTTRTQPRGGALRDAATAADGADTLLGPDAVRGAFLRLAERFRPEETRGLTAAWVVAIDEHSPYTIHVRDGRCFISPGAIERPVARLATDAETWSDIVRGRTDGVAAFLAGRLRVDGDLHLAIRLETLFAPGPESTRIVRTLETDVRGIRIESLVAGHGTPVLLLHGLAANKLSFAPTIDGLAHDHEVHALDLPGFGRSDKPLPSGRRYHPAWMADLVHGYLTNNGIRGAYLVGNSMGGRIATEVALRHPRSIRGVVTLGSAVAFDEWQRLGFLLRAVHGHWLALAPLPVRREWIESGMADVLFHDPDAIPPANMRAGADDVARAIRDPHFRLAVAACARHLAGERALGRRGYWSRLGRLQVPSYWIWGDQDRMVSHRYAERVRDHLPHATIEVWEDVGHVPQFEAPERTLAAIRSFIARIDAGL